jgi:DNA-binding IclR family transcriptional regulator
MPPAQLDALSFAVLDALATTPHGEGMSLPRLGKRLGVGVSALMRSLSRMGEDRIGAVAGPGWVRVTEHDARWMAELTDEGRRALSTASRCA